MQPTYIIQRASRMSQLNHLHSRHEPVDSLVVEARVPRGFESGFEVRASRFLEAEDASARLVEHFDERDVEVCRVTAESEVDGCESVLVRAIDLGGAAGYGPYGAYNVRRELCSHWEW